MWRFGNGSYDPIIEVLEQTGQGNFGITFVVNSLNNSKYKSKYKGFEGWKEWVKDHNTYIQGTVRDSDQFFDSEILLKTKHFFSDHQFILVEREKNVTILNLFIDLQDYSRSPSLKPL